VPKGMNKLPDPDFLPVWLRRLGGAFVGVAMILAAVFGQAGRSHAYNLSGGSWSSIAPLYVCTSTR
jgi:hypothetical protein